jgi:integration host factor subunit alpha
MKPANKTITRQDITAAIYREIGLSKAESAQLVESIISKVSETLISGKNVKFSNFGNFIIRDKAERIGRNPKTGVESVITPRRVVTFRPSPKITNRVTDKLSK